MHYHFHPKSGFAVSALFFLISVSTASSLPAYTTNNCLENDSLYSNTDTGNKTLKDSSFNSSKTNPVDSLKGLSSSKKNILAFNNPDPQTDSSNFIYVPKWYSMITNLPDDMAGFYRQDITIKNVPLFLGIGALTAGMIITDNQTWKASDKIYKRSGFIKSASDIFVEVGDGRSQFGLAAAFALYGYVADDSRALRTASEVVEAVLASGAVVQVLKHITGRESPFLSTKPGGAWRFFPNQIEYHKHVPAFDAYPSGHLTTSLAAFVVIAENYPEIKWIKPVSYSLEALLAVSMVNTGIHWYSDYPLAVFLGYEFGKIIAQHGNSPGGSGYDEKKPHLVIGPYFNQVDDGVSVSPGVLIIYAC